MSDLQDLYDRVNRKAEIDATRAMRQRELAARYRLAREIRRRQRTCLHVFALCALLWVAVSLLVFAIMHPEQTQIQVLMHIVDAVFWLW